MLSFETLIKMAKKLKSQLFCCSGGLFPPTIPTGLFVIFLLAILCDLYVLISGSILAVILKGTFLKKIKFSLL